MNNLFLIAKLDVKESFRSRWFVIYAALFSALMIGFLFSGVTDSRVLGFSGLTRALLLFKFASSLCLFLFSFQL